MGVPSLVNSVVEGYHATIFAYGQTGSGKTFTMEGYKYRRGGGANQTVPVPIIEHGGENEGIVPRAVYLLYDKISQQSNLQKKKFYVYVSFLQVYKEKIYDLLNKGQLKSLMHDGPGLKLKWMK